MYKMGDYTNCYYEIAEIVYENGEYVCTVSQDDVEEFIRIINENEEMKYGKYGEKVEMGDYANCRCDIAEIVYDDDEYDVVCTVATNEVDVVIDILKENAELKRLK